MNTLNKTLNKTRDTPQPTHHPDDSSLMSYAAGSLPEALTTVIACHVSVCPHCQARVQEAETLGQLLLEQQQETAMSAGALDDLLARLEQPQPPVEQPSAQPSSGSEVPAPLQPYLGTSLDQLEWHTLAPGLKQLVIPTSDSKLRLLRISPATSMPVHSHAGSEITMVLRGSYKDELGRFQSGDLADLDPTVQHQPTTDTHQDCICLVATDAPLKFQGILPRLLQPFFRF